MTLTILLLGGFNVTLGLALSICTGHGPPGFREAWQALTGEVYPNEQPVDEFAELDALPVEELLDDGHLAGVRHDGLADHAESIEGEPEDADAYLARGWTRVRRGDLDAAITDYTKAIDLEPDHAEACCHRGVAYTRKGELSLALDDYHQAIELEPSYAKAFYNRGLIRMIQDAVDDALADLSQALRLDPRYARAYRGRALAYERKGETARAMADLEQARQLGSSRQH
jgi:Flp pilus assembly protein TadD